MNLSYQEKFNRVVMKQIHLKSNQIFDQDEIERVKKRMGRIYNELKLVKKLPKQNASLRGK